jgi:hypothetical protein
MAACCYLNLAILCLLTCCGSLFHSWNDTARPQLWPAAYYPAGRANPGEPWRCRQQLYTLDVSLTRPVISDDNSTRLNQLLALSMVCWVDCTTNVGTQQKCVQLNRDYLPTTHRTTVRRDSRVLAFGVLLLFKYHRPRVFFFS